MREVSKHINQNDNVISFEGITFYIIEHLDSFNVDELIDYNSIIINGKDESFIRQIVKRIRSHKNPDVYLKPVFLLKNVSIIDPLVNQLVDGTLFSIDQIGFIKKEVEKILTKNNDIQFTRQISFEAQMIMKTISYMYSRELKYLEPTPYFFSDVNYTYPPLSVNFNHTEEFSIFQIFDQAEYDGILTSEYVDRIYVCSQCSNGHLSYREVCPKCNSSHSKTDDIIHHFPCGYVGPMVDFKNEIDDELDCPKCNKRLRHIGVDYDKPSVIHECLNCSHRFQDYFVKAKCLTCTHDNSVEQLKSQTIKRYALTQKGKYAAVNGYVSTSKDIEDIIGTVKYDTFKTMLKYEVERLKQTEGNSNICAIHINNPNVIYSVIGSEAQKGMLKDVVRIIRSNIRSADVISFQDSSTIVLSMYEIPKKIASRILDEIISILERLMKTAFKNVQVEFEVNIVKLDYNISHELQLHNLTKDFN
ncbi:MAG: TackOD1 domain-containing metal-binding protein [Putridiphycobacter sp.]